MSNDIEWMIIHKTTSQFEAEAMKGNLETNGIPAIILSKKDNSYNSFGYIEVHVDASRKEDALILIKKLDELN